MKVFELHDQASEDPLKLVFEGSFAQQLVLEQALEPLVQALEQHANGWMPDIVEGRRRRKATHASIWKSLDEKSDEQSTSIVLHRSECPAVYLRLMLYFPPLPPELRVALEVQPLSFFAEAERCLQFVELVRAWASRYPVSYAVAHSTADRALAGAPDFGRDEKTARQNGFDAIYAVFWLNVFGRKLVDTVGRERLLSTPAWRVEELPDGSILLVTWPTAADFASPEAREAQARAYLHLRPDLDPSTVRRALHERSATLAPVEPRFPPDLAPLLTRMVARAPLHERQREIARLNDWRPPEPGEWKPANAALPPDVEDPERVVRHYAFLAEHLVAMLHADVPALLQGTPESLTDVDFRLWLEDYPRTRPKEVLGKQVLPALGAYLGQVLVHHLGGAWIPRDRLAEAQVRVGHRVWLPMLRAHHLLSSRQALLDFSLTQLYREAERHRASPTRA